jgi:mannose-1-phosphate guanylyltransferase/phosphomannomutase
LLFEFFDRNGINIDKASERKIENLFFREDFRRTPMDDVGLLDFPTRVLESYSGAFLEALHAKALPTAGFRVAIDYANGNAALVLPRLLNRLNVETIALNAYFDDSRVRIDQSITTARRSRWWTTPAVSLRATGSARC